MSIVLALILIIIIVVVYVIVSYNLLVNAKNTVNTAWSDIETQIKRRYDLTPALVEVVKGYAKHESDTLENVIKARNTAIETKGGAEMHSEAEKNLSRALKSLIAVSEKYPDLKASENFLKLQFELTDIEDRIKASRRFYNTTVMALNTKIEQFPGNLIAKHYKFKQAGFFELPHEEAAAASKGVEVKL